MEPLTVTAARELFDILEAVVVDARGKSVNFSGLLNTENGFPEELARRALDTVEAESAHAKTKRGRARLTRVISAFLPAPYITDLELSDVRDADCDVIFIHSHLPRLRSLTLRRSRHLTWLGMKKILKNMTTTLVSLELNDCPDAMVHDDDDEDDETLLCEAIARLERFATSGLIKGLSESFRLHPSHPLKLKSLEIRDNLLANAPDVVDALAYRDDAAQDDLTKLALSHTRYPLERFDSLFFLVSLRELDLSYCEGLDFHTSGMSREMNFPAMWRALVNLETLNVSGLRGMVSTCFNWDALERTGDGVGARILDPPLPSLRVLVAKSSAVGRHDSSHHLLPFLERAGFFLDASDNANLVPDFFAPFTNGLIPPPRGGAEPPFVIVLNDSKWQDGETIHDVPRTSLRELLRVYKHILAERGGILKSNILEEADDGRPSVSNELVLPSNLDDLDVEDEDNMSRVMRFVRNFERDVMGERLPREGEEEEENDDDDRERRGRYSSSSSSWKRWCKNEIALSGITFCACEACRARLERGLDAGAKLTYSRKQLLALRDSDKVNENV